MYLLILNYQNLSIYINKHITSFNLDTLLKSLEVFHCNCGKIYKYRRSLSLHQKYECGKEPQFACRYCPYKVTSFSIQMLNSHLLSLPPLLKLHINGNEGSTILIGDFRCHCCYLKLDELEFLKWHMATNCGRGPQLYCILCEYATKNKSALQSHVARRHLSSTLATGFLSMLARRKIYTRKSSS
ncbi:hypothetical protein GE061_020273 [Apolygus lucorum]|uniref:C2H2-type domain-containing protein n=1 Tax=Apolygus lucorum TaxID=248454 RepID=A0A8S9WM56_APOLU|nr:hypothetical protein GE061_020273 [Apolygus lucorum]